MFGDHNYQQSNGTAMGAKMALCVANLFMASIEKTFIDDTPLKPLFHVWFIDNISMMRTHGHEEHEKLTIRVNSTNPSIKLSTKYLPLVYLYAMYLFVSLKKMKMRDF